MKLLHAQSTLSDEKYFNIDYVLEINPFLVYIDNYIFQVDPKAFSLNGVLIILYEIINLSTGMPLDRLSVMGKLGNFSLKKIKGIGNLEDNFTTLSNSTMPEIIYNRGG